MLHTPGVNIIHSHPAHYSSVKTIISVIVSIKKHSEILMCLSMQLYIYKHLIRNIRSYFINGHYKSKDVHCLTWSIWKPVWS